MRAYIGCVIGVWGGWVEPDYASITPLYERSEVSCDLVDNDCDGAIDEWLIEDWAPLAVRQIGVCEGFLTSSSFLKVTPSSLLCFLPVCSSFSLRRSITIII